MRFVTPSFEIHDSLPLALLAASFGSLCADTLVFDILRFKRQAALVAALPR